MSIFYSAKSDSPPINMIRGMRISWPALIAELVDNSYDAGAKRVEVLLEPRGLIVRDDGHGIKDLSLLLKFGDHDPTFSTKLGRYGVGAKSVIFRGDLIRITTVYEGARFRVYVDVPNITDWDHLPGEGPIPTEDPPGTIIEVLKVPDQPRIIEAHVRDALGHTFAPAITAGRQILLGMMKTRCTPVAAWTPPLLKHVIEGTHDFGDGRTFTYHAGLVEDVAPKHRGTWIAYAHRYLDQSKLGFDASPGARVHVQVHLHETRYKLWKLEVHKRELLERHKQDVADVLAELLVPLFEADEFEQRDVKVKGANAILDAAFEQAGGTSTPRPGKGQKGGGPFGPKQGGTPPTEPKGVKPDGPIDSKRTRRRISRGLSVRIEPFGEAAEPFRYAQANQHATITFNSDHLLWKQISNDEVAIAREALFIYTHSDKKQLTLFNLTDDYLTACAADFGRLLRIIHSPFGVREAS